MEKKLCPLGSRFTLERVQLRFFIIKKDGKRAIFNRDKLANSVITALRKERRKREKLISAQYKD